MGAEPRHLSEVLAELASLSAEPFDVHELVQVACDRAVEALDVDGAIVTLSTAGSPLAMVGAAGEPAEIESLLAFEQTPCAAAVAANATVFYDVEAEPDRFADYAVHARSLEVRHTFATPMRHGDTVLGTLSLVRIGDRPFTDETTGPARQLADVVVARIVQAEELQAAVAVRQQLEHALEARVVIEQAKGMVAAELSVTVDQALVLIRTFSRSQQLRLAEVSADIVSRKLPMMLLRS